MQDLKPGLSDFKVVALFQIILPSKTLCFPCCRLGGSREGAWALRDKKPRTPAPPQSFLSYAPHKAFTFCGLGLLFCWQNDFKFLDSGLLLAAVFPGLASQFCWLRQSCVSCCSLEWSPCRRITWKWRQRNSSSDSSPVYYREPKPQKNGILTSNPSESPSEQKLPF